MNDRDVVRLVAVCLLLGSHSLLSAQTRAPARPNRPTPTITSIQVTPTGYILVGKGFGSTASAVQVFEGTRRVSAKVITSVQDTRVTVAHVVAVGTPIRIAVSGVPSVIVRVGQPARTTTPSSTPSSSTPPPSTAPTLLTCPAVGASVCRGNGTCDSSSGKCMCKPGFAGPACQFSDLATCGGHGKADDNGACMCEPAFTGKTCLQCGTNYFSYPYCRYCLATTTCSGHGTCDPLTGYCQCVTGFNGPNCSTRVP
jgi:hypothetical protein